MYGGIRQGLEGAGTIGGGHSDAPKVSAIETSDVTLEREGFRSTIDCRPYKRIQSGSGPTYTMPNAYSNNSRISLY